MKKLLKKKIKMIYINPTLVLNHYQNNSETSQNTEQQSNLSNNMIKKRNKAPKTDANKAEQNASDMVIAMCSLSLIAHSMLLLCIVFYFYYVNFTAVLIGFIGNFSVIFKHSTNMFAFYLFNRKFRVFFKSLIR